MDSSNNESPQKPTDIDFDELARILIGPSRRISDRIILPISLAGHQFKSKEELRVEAVFESCTFKTVTSCAVG